MWKYDGCFLENNHNSNLKGPRAERRRRRSYCLGLTAPFAHHWFGFHLQDLIVGCRVGPNFFFIWVLTTLELALDQAKIFKALKANLTNKIFSLSQAIWIIRKSNLSQTGLYLKTKCHVEKIKDRWKKYVLKFWHEITL